MANEKLDIWLGEQERKTKKTNWLCNRTVPVLSRPGILDPGNEPPLLAALRGAYEEQKTTSDCSLTSVTPFPGFGGDLSVAVGDVDGDTLPDVAVASGPGIPTQVIVYSGADKTYTKTIAALSGLTPFGTAMGGANVALADLNADHLDDLIVGSGPGGGHVVVYDAATGTLLDDFAPYEDAFQGGVFVTAGMVEEGGRTSLFAAPGAGRMAEVKMYNYDLFGDDQGVFPDLHASLSDLRREVATFDGAEDPQYEGGLFVAIGYPRAPWGGFANLVTSTLTGPAQVRLWELSAHEHGEAMVSATGVHKAVAYSPDAMRMATRVALTDLSKQDMSYQNGAKVAVYSTLDGANLLTLPAGDIFVARRWTINGAGDGFDADMMGLPFVLGGSAIAGM